MTATITPIGSGIDHPEGVAWDPFGALVVGTEAGKVHWLDHQSGEILRTFDVGEGLICGSALDARGRAYVCDISNARVARVDPKAGIVETYSSGPAEDPFQVPNYPVFDAAGRLYVSDSRDWGKENGAVMIIEPGGAARVGATAAKGFTNGLAISPDGAWLHVVESNPPMVSRLAIAGDGSLGEREVVVEMPRSVPDGVAFTDSGRLLVTCYRPDAMYAVDDGQLTTIAEDWSGLTMAAPTNIAFGGDDLSTLYSANFHAYHVSIIGAGLTGARLHYPDID